MNKSYWEKGRKEERKEMQRDRGWKKRLVISIRNWEQRNNTKKQRIPPSSIPVGMGIHFWSRCWQGHAPSEVSFLISQLLWWVLINLGIPWSVAAILHSLPPFPMTFFSVCLSASAPLIKSPVIGFKTHSKYRMISSWVLHLIFSKTKFPREITSLGVR